MITLFALLLPASADDLLVPEDYPSVQEAVDNAGVGDHIIVTSSQDGSIVVDGDVLTIHGIGMNDIVLTGNSDPVLEVIGDANVTLSYLTIDGEGARRTVLVDGSSTALTTEGVKIRDGYQGSEGAGIRQVNGTVTLTDSILCGHFADNKSGGGVQLESNGTFSAIRTVFYDNVSDSNPQRGGAVNFEGNGSLSFTTLLANRADKGAAVQADGVTVTLSDSIIANNEDHHNGDSEVVWGEGGGGAFVGGHNLFDNNLGGDMNQAYFPDDIYGAVTPGLVNDSPGCASSTFVDFTSVAGGDSATNDVGAAGVDSDGDGYGDRIDCAPSDIDVHPDATEVPGDGVDQNCDGLERCFVDSDGDGFPGPQMRYSTFLACNDATHDLAPDGAPDCDDSDPGIGGSDPEIPGDGIDQDCDGFDDCFADNDNDGFRTTTSSPGTTLDCSGPQELPATAELDCDDGRAGVNPSATETIGDGRDQDCDGQEICYLDGDNDGYRTTATIPSTDDDCNDSGEARASDPSGDCDDSAASVNPGATEVIGDGVDQDCDLLEECYVDADNDGARTTATVASADADCTDNGEGEAGDAIDCNDGNANIYPGATERIAQGGDEDCDGFELCYADGDNDGYRTSSTVDSADADCADSGEAVPSDPAGDCNDANASIHPGAIEQVGEGGDQDCDGVEFCYADADNDGWRTNMQVLSTTDADCDDVGEARADQNALDCDDFDANRNPGLPELPGDEIDSDCNGSEDCYKDSDNDGHHDILGGIVVSPDALCDGPNETTSSIPEDCDDDDPNTYPDAPEQCDKVDNDCDTLVDNGVTFEDWWPDADADGFGDEGATSINDCQAPPAHVSNDSDCDDTNEYVSPGATEVGCNGVDDDCNGMVDEGSAPTDYWPDADNDGFGDESATPVTSCEPVYGFVANALDCNDDQTTISPAFPEIPCNGIDDDCNEDSEDDNGGCDTGDPYTTLDTSDTGGDTGLPTDADTDTDTDTDSDSDTDTDSDTDSDTDTDTDTDADTDIEETQVDPRTPLASDGCACSATTPVVGWLLLPLGAMAMRRREGPAHPTR